ncbi:hypothetical protein CK203_045824 [Vitis vinifera]|uniref:BED-type domain-containing protein n=1 Tax=Vitis vinifera TaxID=29760 RepID=A0A438FLY6_VITVI|nr:hypothetical protein CK203_045824 [Vitis vinifera]
MASEGGSAVPGRDPAWKYCLPIEGNRNGTICNFCGLVMKSGGITRFKSHLMHKDPHNNTKKCPRVPPEVKEEIRLLVHDKQKAKAKKNADIEEICSQLRGTMGTHHTHLVNEDDDDEDVEDEDVYMYPTDMNPDERDAYRSAVRASKASNWEREQHENIVGSKRKSGESSTAKQKNIKDIFKGGAIKETMGRLISKFFIYESVAPAKAKSHHFKNMIIGAQQAGMGIEPPSPYEIKNKYLEMEYKEMEAYSVDASNYIKDHKYIYELLKTIIKEVGKENVVQIVIDNGSAFMKAGKQLMKKYNLYWTPCVAHYIDLIFEDIGKRPNVIEVINNARKITNFIYNHGWLLAQMRKYCGGDIVRPRATRLTNIVSLYEPLYVVLRLVDSEVVPTMPFVYKLMHVMKENFIRQGAGDWMFKIIQDRWQKTLKHPLHAAAYFLNPRFQYRHGVGSDPELLQAIHDVFAKLDPTTESLGQFGNELVLFRNAKRGFGDRAAIASRSTMVPAEWWFMYGNQTPTLRKLAIKVLSQTASSSACERNWSTFALIHTKQRNRLAYPRLEQLVFCYYNMRLKLRDMEAENDRVAEKDYLDLLDISAEVGEEEDNQLFQWVRPIHLDDEVGNPDPRIAAHAREFGVNVERVLSEEVHSESFSKDTNDSLHATYSHQEIDSTSAGYSSRPSAAGTSASGYDGSRGGTDDGGDNGGGDIDECRHSQYPINQFTCENDFTHCTQDEDHGSRRADTGIGAIGRPYRGRE